MHDDRVDAHCDLAGNSSVLNFVCQTAGQQQSGVLQKRVRIKRS
jgi:hypothetical protein